MLLKKVLKRVFSFIIFLLLIVNFHQVSAYTSNDGIILETVNGNNEGIFNKEKDGLWAPGNTKISEFVVYNNSLSDIKLEKISFSKRSDYVVDKENVIIKNSSVKISDEEGISLYEGSIESLLNKYKMINNGVTIKSGDNKKLLMTININEDLGNEAQVIEENLDFLLSYLKDNNGIEGNNKNSESLPETGVETYKVLLLFLGNILLISGVFMLKAKRF